MLGKFGWSPIFFVGVFFSFLSCIEDVDRVLSEDETNLLLNNGYEKQWFIESKKVNGNLVSLENCIGAVKVVFVEDEDSDYMYMVDKMSFCASNQDPDTLLNSSYELVTNSDSDFENQIELSDASEYDVDVVNVTQLTSLNLTITYTLEGNLFEERYVYIADRYVSKVDANYLLSNYGLKTWYRDFRSEDGQSVVLDSCVGDLNLVFENSDLDKIYFIEQVARCEEGIEPDTVYSSYYDLSANENDDFTGLILLEDINGNSLGEIGVTDIASDTLGLNYISNGIELIETYSDITE